MATWTNKFGLTLEYDPNANYIFTDANGNQVMHGGDNGYVAQSVTENMPIYVSNTDGRWYTEPYVEVIEDKIVTHVPEWFKETPEYNDWNNQLATFDLDRMTDQQKNEAQEVMADIGRVGAGRRALRNTLANTYHLTDPAAQNAVINNLTGISQGGEGTIAAFSNGQMGEQENINDVLEVIANVRREHGSESISRTMTGYQDTLQKAMEGRQVDTQELVEAITQTNLMTAVQENPGKFNNPDYANIWETSVAQNINAFFHSVSSAMIQAIPFTEALLQAGYSIAGGEGRAIDAYNEQLNNPLYGGGLEGQETAVALGSLTGNVASFATMVSAGMVTGGMVSTKLASTITPASTLGRVGTALGSTAVGTAAVDFATNDLPTDLVYGVSDFSARLGANGGDVGEAFGYAWSRPSSDPAEPNRLFFFFGPDVGEGFLGNLAQDAVIDGVLFAVPILQAVGGSVGRRIDDLAGGAFSRFGEQVALMNLSLQDKVSRWPVIRNVVDFVNTKVINPQDAELMHQARQAAIASRSMTPYVNAQNAITLRNHRGMPAISAELRTLDKQYGISESVNNFARNSRSYGGMGKTIFDDPSVPESKRVIIDQVPEQVKRGVNNYMALADGERRLSHISADDDREEVAQFREQIAALRAEVDALPDEIKEFARRLSDCS